ncbi:MAG: hypothetical protein LBG75_00740 [Candidatus Nomurabacteria bacterium]|jgi:hypothetical protein|nr:hypothetical protein [Candidatus Nomurabacteria bacterium]
MATPKTSNQPWTWGMAAEDFKDYSRRNGRECVVEVVDSMGLIFRKRIRRSHRENAVYVPGSQVVLLLGPVSQCSDYNGDRIGVLGPEGAYWAHKGIAEYFKFSLEKAGVNTNTLSEVLKNLPEIYKPQC